MPATLLDCFGHWRVPPSPRHELLKADAMLTHEFGNQKDVSLTTESFVIKACHLALAIGKPIICQHPGERVAQRLGIRPCLVIRRNLLDENGYLDTNEVNRQTALYCHACGWHKIAVFTHPHHLWRAGENLRLQDIEPLYPDMSDVPYDWTMLWKRWQVSPIFPLREIGARYVYSSKSYI